MATRAKAKRLTCDQCQLVRINGIVCHETGCPVAWKGYYRECKNCGQDFKPKEEHQMCCDKACTRMYGGY